MRDRTAERMEELRLMRRALRRLYCNLLACAAVLLVVVVLLGVFTGLVSLLANGLDRQYETQTRLYGLTPPEAGEEDAR